MPWPRTNSGGRCRRPGRFPGEPGLNEKSRPLECSGGRFFLMPSRARMALTRAAVGRVEGPRLLRRGPGLGLHHGHPPLDLKHGRHRRRAHPAADTPGGVHIDCHALPPFPRAAPAVPFYCNTPRRFLQVFSAAGGTFFPQTPSCIWETLCNLVDFVAPFPFTFPPVYAILKRIM